MIPGPIGVFDSGVGGLTVLRALRSRLPEADFIYLGDTARLPYGTKSPDTVRRYALQAAETLRCRDVRALVVACNTASGVALDALAGQWPDVPVVGVVEPGAAAVCRRSRTGNIAVIGTESTIRGGAYQAAIARLRPEARVRVRACSVFVALAEEGWFDTPAAAAVAAAYLDDWLQGDDPPDSLVLGCTHFPVLSDLIRRVAGDDLLLVDSASTTAEVLAAVLAARRGSAGDPGAMMQSAGGGSVQFLATDGADRFARVGSRFLGETIDPADVEIVDL